MVCLHVLLRAPVERLIRPDHDARRGLDALDALGSVATLVYVDIAVAIIAVLLLVVLPAAVVGAMFVWAALKDGEEDRALQARLGIRRRTRLGR
jgi:hypothetical protein